MQDGCMMRDGCKMRAFCILRACRAVQGCTHFAFCILLVPFQQYALSSPRAFCILQGLHLGSCKMRASTHFACLRKNARCTHFAFCIWCLLHAAARAGSNGRRDTLYVGFNEFHDILWVGLGVRLGTHRMHRDSIAFNEFYDILLVGLGIRLGSYGVHWHSLGFNDKIFSTGAWASG